MVDPQRRARDWSVDDRQLLVKALRRPRGRYTAQRAAQLAGVPRSTVYDWAREGVVEPDYQRSRPMYWSYRDLVFLRMMAWLRTLGMERRLAVDRISFFRDAFAHMTDLDGFEQIKSDGKSILIGESPVDEVTGAQVLDQGFLAFLDDFRLVVPAEVEELGSTRLWGPDLLTPVEHVAIDPWVMGGDPCVYGTRIPTSTIFALMTQRELRPEAIATLYRNALSEDDIESAANLENALKTRTPIAASA